MPKYTYTTDAGVELELDRYHIHELIDRIDCVRRILEDLVEGHWAGDIVKGHIWDAQQALGRAYQQAAEIDLED